MNQKTLILTTLIIFLSLTTISTVQAYYSPILVGALSRNGTLITMGYLYPQAATDVNFTLGQNTLVNNGLIFNINETSTFSYAPGDVLSITQILVYNNGTYNQVNATILETQNIDANPYNSNSGSSAQTTGGNDLLLMGITASLVIVAGAAILISRRKSIIK